MWTLFILIVILALYFHLKPSFDRLETGERVVWYNVYGRGDFKHREYIILWK